MRDGDRYADHHDWGWGPWWLMMLMMLVFLGLVAWGLFMLWRATTGATDVGRRSGGVQAPEAILADRLARGEIDPEEYRARLDALRSRGS